MTFEELIMCTVDSQNKDGELVKIFPDLRVAYRQELFGHPHVIILASGINSDTLDFVVNGNELVPLDEYMGPLK